MNDIIIRATAAGQEVRAFASVTAGLVEEARTRHQTHPTATAALGRLLTAGAMMGAMMKGEKDLLTLQIRCDGPIGGLTVTADSKGNVKGYAENPAVDLPPSPAGKLDVSAALGQGLLTVIRDLGMKEPYSGQVALVSGEIAEDLTYYFAESEQIPSAVGLGVLMNKENTVRRAGGFIVQVMPFAREETIARLEKNVAAIGSVTALLEEEDSPEYLLSRVLQGFDLEITDRSETRFHCGCSRERVEKALISIGRQELREMIDEGKEIELNCHFCNTNYPFPVEDLKRILLKTRTSRIPEPERKKH